MTPATWSLPDGLNPTPPQAREWLRQELHGADYKNPWLESLVRWISDLLGRIFDGVSHLAGLSPVVTVLMAVLVIGLLAWVLPKVRREPAVSDKDSAVLEDVTITARLYRDLATQALREERYDDAVLNGFRAIAKDMSDREVLNDAPGRTAHEVSLALASPFPGHAARLGRAADLFDAVRYGHRRSSAYQASQIQELDAELADTSPLLLTSSPEGLRI